MHLSKSIDFSIISKNESNISSNLTKITDNESNISSSLTKITDNESNISSNLTKITDNESNISSNLTKIKELNQNKTYLKNVYNILFYNKKTQIDFRNLFYEKLFQVNVSINDFMEMNFKISIEYESISERNYVKLYMKF